MNYQLIDKCRSCSSKKIKKVLDLGNQPLANSLLKSVDELEETYPLSISFCENCKLVQLNETIKPEKLFSQYVWVTGTSKTAIDYSQVFYKNIIGKLNNLEKSNQILEIASNDGSFLKPFLQNGFDVIGVDPASNIAEIANENGIETINSFFGESVAKKIKKEYKKLDVIFARNVLPHVANLHEFIKGINICASTDTLIVIEIHYAKTILNELHYDSIYHEHLCYFTLESVNNLFKQFGMNIFDIDISPISGGSLVLYISKKNLTQSNILKQYLKNEKEEKINNLNSWQNFSDKVNNHRDKLLSIINKESKNKICGYGASARSSTLLNYCELNYLKIDSIADQNLLKHNLLTAGTHIPIKSPETLMAQKPNTILLLAWNFKEEIIGILRNKYNFEGDVIIPLPNEPKIIKYEDNNEKQ